MPFHISLYVLGASDSADMKHFRGRVSFSFDPLQNDIAFFSFFFYTIHILRIWLSGKYKIFNKVKKRIRIIYISNDNEARTVYQKGKDDISQRKNSFSIGARAKTGQESGMEENLKGMKTLQYSVSKHKSLKMNFDQVPST